MAKKINVRKILSLHHQNLSVNQIAKGHHFSKHSVIDVIHRANELKFDDSTLGDLNDEELYQLFFPEKFAGSQLYFKPDYEHVHQELKEHGVTLKLLWQEYCDTVPSNLFPISYPSFCAGYNDYYVSQNLTNRVIHKPGVRTEVDWAGKHMFFTDIKTGDIIEVHLFVATLPFSQYSYVEPTLNEKMDTWIKCHVHMFEYFGGSTLRVVCDNLKTGVASHPKEGDIVLTDTYAAFGDYYLTAIMPADVRKPKQKPSTEGTVGKIETHIIAKLRNKNFSSFIELKDAVAKELEVFNAAEFQKREGSRKLVFENEEKKYLRKLPKEPFEIITWEYDRKVNLDCHIIYKHNRYSVPFQYVGKYVDLRVGENTLAIYYKNKRLSTHSLFPSYAKNQYSTHSCDMPDYFQKMEWDDQRILEWAKSIGPCTLKTIQIIFNMVKVKEQGYNPALSILNLSKKYTSQRLENACQLALQHYSSPRYKHLNAILSHNQDIEEKKNKDSNHLQKDVGHLRGADFFKKGGNSHNE